MGNVLGASKIAKHFRYGITENAFTFERDEDTIVQEAALDGIYVVRSSVTHEELNSGAVVRAYRTFPRWSGRFGS